VVKAIVEPSGVPSHRYRERYLADLTTRANAPVEGCGSCAPARAFPFDTANTYG
jgi:hypothetical protein